jgi:hypothetical protein
MRDYVKMATLIDHDQANEPGAARLAYFFDTVEEAQAQLASDQSFIPTMQADLLDFRWYGYTKASLIKLMNSAYFLFSNYQLFIDGYDGESLGISQSIWTESPRHLGLNSLTEKPHRRRK